MAFGYGGKGIKDITDRTACKVHGVVKSKGFGDAGSLVLHRVFLVAGWRMRPERKEGAQCFRAVIAVLGSLEACPIDGS